MTNTQIITVNWPVFTHVELNPASPPATTEGRKKARADDEAVEVAISPGGARNYPVTIVADGTIEDPDGLPDRSFAGAVFTPAHAKHPSEDHPEVRSLQLPRDAVRSP